MEQDDMKKFCFANVLLKMLLSDCIASVATERSDRL